MYLSYRKYLPQDPAQGRPQHAADTADHHLEIDLENRMKTQTIVTSPVTSQSPGYQLTASLTPGKELDTLELTTTWPGAKHPTPHRVLQLTLEPARLRELGWFLIDSTD